MRYQPLVSATGKSGFDRGGYTGYNIRGLEANRVSIDVDGVELPNATGRSYVSRAGLAATISTPMCTAGSASIPA